AQVFQLTAISEALKDAIQRLDDARDQGRALSQEEVSSFGALADKLSALAQSPERPLTESDREPRSMEQESSVLAAEPSVGPAISSSAPSSPLSRPLVGNGGGIGRKSATIRGLGAPVESLRAGARGSREDIRSLTETVLSVLVVDEVEGQEQVRSLAP